MTGTRASLIGWGAFLAAGMAAAVGGYGAQFAFAVAAIGGLGLPHGASDLAVVPPPRRASFLLAYGGCIALVMLLWRVDPVAAMALLLLASAVHFAVDAEADADWLERGATGLFLVAAPALLHPQALGALFVAATGDPSAAARLTDTLRLLAIGSTAVVAQRLVVARISPPERRLRAAAVVATLLLPPLVGFAIGFVLLHARGQTAERQRKTGCATTLAYLRSVAPFMVGAAAVLGLVAWQVLRAGSGGSATILFAGIAALATPHMLVTPLWQRLGRHSRLRPVNI